MPNQSAFLCSFSFFNTPSLYLSLPAEKSECPHYQHLAFYLPLNTDSTSLYGNLLAACGKRLAGAMLCRPQQGTSIFSHGHALDVRLLNSSVSFSV